MKKVTAKIFYAGLFRFQILIFLAAVIPPLVIKILFFFQQSANKIEPVLDLLLLAGLSLSIVGGCVYILFYYSSVDKTLEPVTRMAEVGELAARVAHDLRGPLSGIGAVLNYLYSVETRDKNLLNHLNLLELSSKRLHNIAGDLLQKRRGKDEESGIFNLHQVLDELIGEYTAQPVLKGIQFLKHYADRSIFLSGRRNKIERLFGNVIKNAIEAMDFEGQITIMTKALEGNVSVAIQDTGPGMDTEKISKILKGGFTEGKKEGHGIGLTFVREVLAEHGGLLAIDSSLGQGSVFRFEFPWHNVAATPFVIEVESDQPVLLFDDDPSILEQWALILNGENVMAQAFLRFEDYVVQKKMLPLMTTAVVDYHFENSELNGFDVICKLKKIGFKNVYLCSGEYWKPSLKKQAEELGVAICPKPLPRIRVEVEKCRSVEVERQKEKEKLLKGGYKVLVIDDELMIRMAWEVVDRTLQIEKLYAFANLEAMEAGAVDLRNIDIAFVDKNISGSRFSGAEVVNYLKARGVPKVILASGENEETLRGDPQFAQADFVISEKIPQSFRPFFS